MIKKPYIIFSFAFLFLFSLFIGIDRFIHRKSEHFFLSKIAAGHEAHPEWDTPTLSLEEKKVYDKVVNQTFTFFAKTNHAYLFLSEDQKYIIKFLKQQTFRPKTWLAYIPVSFNPYYHEYCKKNEERKKIFTACARAFSDFKEEAGLIYVHINPSHTLNKKISLYNKKGKHYFVDLDTTSFYIQKHAQPIYPRISELMRIGDIERCKKIIDSIFSLIDYLSKEDLCHPDLNLHQHFGLIEDKAVQLAISELQKNSSPQKKLSYQHQAAIILEPLHRWIKKNYPELFPYLDEKLKNNAVCKFS